MTAVIEAVEQVRDRVESAGIRAVIDPRDINPPCAWVTVDQVRDNVLAFNPEVDVAVLLIVPDTGHRIALSALSGLLDQLLSAARFVVDQPIEPESVTLPSGGSPLPAFKLITTV